MSTDRRYGVIAGLAIKVPCVASSSTAITLSGLQTVDGVVLAADDRVLVNGQADNTTNGIYVVSTGSWTRDLDFDGQLDAVKGTLIKVNGGTLNQGFWYCSSANPIVIGTSAITFIQSSSVLAVISAYIQTLLDDTSPAAAQATLQLPVQQACTATGDGDTIVLTPVGTAATLADGLELSFIPNLTSTSVAFPTINYNGGGAVAVYAPDNMYYAFAQAFTKGAPAKVRYVLADTRWVVVSAQLSFEQAVALRHGVMQLSPITATTFTISGDGMNGVLVWDATKLAFNVALIGPGGLAATNLASCSINGVAAQSAAANTLYYVYLTGATQPTVDLSTTGPALTYNSLYIKTGDISRTYMGVLYTLDTGGGIDIRVDANGAGTHSQLVNVTHSDSNLKPLLLQTDQITVNGFNSATFIEIATTLRADVVMDARLGCFYRVYGYAVLDTVGATVGLEAYQGQSSPFVNNVCLATGRGVGDSVPLISTYGRALATGRYGFQAQGKVSAGTANFHLTAELWACI